MTASDDFSAVEVPAAPETIRRFIEIHRLTYENDYLEIKNTVQNKLKDLDIYKVYGRDFVLGESFLPIRLLPTPTKCRVSPFSRVEPVEGRRCGPAGDSEQ